MEKTEELSRNVFQKIARVNAMGTGIPNVKEFHMGHLMQKK